MSNGIDRHPADPGDTDWGQKIDAQHGANLTRLDGIDTRLGLLDGHVISLVAEQERVAVSLARLDERMKASEDERKVMRKDLNANTELTKLIKGDTDSIKTAQTEIATNTQWILSIARGARGFKKFLMWASPIASAIIAAFAMWTVKK